MKHIQHRDHGEKRIDHREIPAKIFSAQRLSNQSLCALRVSVFSVFKAV